RTCRSSVRRAFARASPGPLSPGPSCRIWSCDLQYQSPNKLAGASAVPKRRTVSHHRVAKSLALALLLLLVVGSAAAQGVKFDADEPARVAAVMRGDADLSAGYAKAFGGPLPSDDEALLIDVGKALAAYQEMLISARTPFDAFRDALAKGDAHDVTYPAAAQRGLRVL